MKHTIVKIAKDREGTDQIQVRCFNDKRDMQTYLALAGIRPHEDTLSFSNGIHRDKEGHLYLIFRGTPEIGKVLYKI